LPAVSVPVGVNVAEQVYGEPLTLVQFTVLNVPAAVELNVTSLAVGSAPAPAHDNVPVTVNADSDPAICVTGDPLVGDVIADVVPAFVIVNVPLVPVVALYPPPAASAAVTV
jgi:hypothetical protein